MRKSKGKSALTNGSRHLLVGSVQSVRGRRFRDLIADLELRVDADIGSPFIKTLISTCASLALSLEIEHGRIVAGEAPDGVHLAQLALQHRRHLEALGLIAPGFRPEPMAARVEPDPPELAELKAYLEVATAGMDGEEPAEQPAPSRRTPRKKLHLRPKVQAAPPPAPAPRLAPPAEIGLDPGQLRAERFSRRFHRSEGRIEHTEQDTPPWDED